MYTVADVGQPQTTTDKVTPSSTRRAKSATVRSAGQLKTERGRANCCFNLRRMSCICATNFAGDLGGVIEDCIFSPAIVNATLIAGPNPVERNKMARYERCRSAVGTGTAVVCSGRTPRTHGPNAAVSTPQRRRRPVTAAAQMTSAGGDDTTGRGMNAIAKLIPRLYRTYGYQFTTSYRQPAAPPPPPPPPPPISRLTAVEVSEDDATAVSAMSMRHRSSVSAARRTDRDRERDRTSSARFLKHSTTSHGRHH